MSERKDVIQQNLKKLDVIKDVLRELSRYTNSAIRNLSWYNRRIAGTMRDLAQILGGALIASTSRSLPRHPEA